VSLVLRKIYLAFRNNKKITGCFNDYKREGWEAKIGLKEGI